MFLKSLLLLNMHFATCLLCIDCNISLKFLSLAKVSSSRCSFQPLQNTVTLFMLNHSQYLDISTILNPINANVNVFMQSLLIVDEDLMQM